MIGLTVVFFSPDLLTKWLPAPTKATSSSIQISNWSKQAMVLFIAIQLTLPMRYLLYPGQLFWNEEGFRFSWRVMLMHKEGLATFYVKDAKTGGEIEVDNRKFLNKRQEEQMSTQPDMLLQYAHYLREKFEDSVLVINGASFRIENPSVTANVFVALNGRPSQKLVDKSTILTDKNYNLKHRDWIQPMQP